MRPALASPVARLIAASSLIATSAAAAVLVDFSPESPFRKYEPRGSYVVLVDDSAYRSPAWRAVAARLRRKHDAALVVYPDGDPRAALPALRRTFPRYACFVVPPERAGRSFVVAVHRLTRRLDEDPYTDVVWGILTGYEPADALRIAGRAEPLVVRRAAGSMGPGVFGGLDGGFASSETNAGDYWRKKDGGEVVHEKVSPDPAEALARAFNTTPPDLFVTSGHATERDWQIGYTVRAGQFRCEKGRLYALGTDGRRHDIRSSRPKVYTPVGNCLIGHIPGKDCMAAAWIHSGGVHQMFGYTAVTFYGYMGWGTGTLFRSGRYTLAQAFYLNNQALVHRLVTRYPEKAGIDFRSYDRRAPAAEARRHGITDRDLLGALWDRDCVALYGDPGWEARMPPEPPAWTYRLEERDGRYAFTLRTLKAGKWGNRPVMAFLPHRLSEVSDVVCTGPVRPVVTGNFVLLPLRGDFEAREERVVTFRARPVAPARTSADTPPVRLRLPRN